MIDMMHYPVILIFLIHIHFLTLPFAECQPLILSSSVTQSENLINPHVQGKVLCQVLLSQLLNGEV